MVKEVLRKNWPNYLPETLEYKYGKKPLHEYLEENANNRPDDIAYIFYGREITWKELNDGTSRLAQFFREQGIKKGDRIALFMQNCPQYIIGHYAIQRLGAIVVPLNPMYKQSELDYLINEVKIKAVIVSQELYGRIDSIRKKLPTIGFIVTTNYADYLPEKPTIPIPNELKHEKEQIEETYDLSHIIESTHPLKQNEDINIEEDLGMMIFTSGTTGRPKAAMLTYANALFKTASTATTIQYGETDRTVVIPPFCHIGGMIVGVYTPIYSGCKSVILTRFEPEAAITAIEKYKINIWYTLATMNVAILNHPNIEKRNLTSLETNFATSFGIPVSEELAEEWKRVTDGCLLYEAAYGLTETHDVDTFMPKDNIKFGTCGIPTYHTKLKIIDVETGKELPPNEEGEIVIKSPGVFKGYYNLSKEEEKETLRDGWVHTGDIGKIDEEGYLYLYGRIKEMIKSSGFSVFPEDVESLLDEHKAVLQTAVVGVPDRRRGENVKAFIVLKPEYKGKVTEQDIINWSRENMAAYKYPREVEFRDRLPEAISGKVLRRLLSEEN